MPGQQLEAPQRGKRAELLASYILSSIAAVTHVRREDDYGMDLLCTLVSKQRNVLRAGRAFGVQVKSASDPLVKYGGLDKHGNWKGYEIDWLFNQDQPLIIALVELEKFQVRLYGTIRIWYLRYQIGRNPGEIVLVPDEDLLRSPFEPYSHQSRYKDEPLSQTSDGRTAGNGFSYRVPLGKPLIVMSVDGYDEETLNAIRGSLDGSLDLEYMNIRYRGMDVAYYSEWQSWEPNQLPGPQIQWQFWNSTAGAHVDNLLANMRPLVQSLMFNLAAQIDSLGANPTDPYTKWITAIIPFVDWMREMKSLDKMGLDALAKLKSRISN